MGGHWYETFGRAEIGLYRPAGHPFFDVSAYGAAADGATDDTDAVQAALDAAHDAGAGIVWFGPGTYLCDGTTRPRVAGSNVTIQGAGAGQTSIVCSTLYDGTPATDIDAFIIGQGGGAEVSNVAVSGLEFAFTGPTTPLRGAGACLRVSRCHNVTISHCKFRYGSLGIHLNRAHGFVIHDCEVADQAADGIHCSNGTDITGTMTIRDGRIHDNWVHDVHDDCVAIIGRQDGEDARRRPENVTIHNNLLGPTTTNGNGVGVYGIDRCTVAANRIHNPASCFVNVEMSPLYDTYPSTNVDIIGNDCVSDQAPDVDGPAGRLCISIGGRNTVLTGNELDEPFNANIRVAGNRFKVNDRSGLWCQPRNTITADMWLDGVTIADNIFEFFGTPPEKIFRGMHLVFVNNLTIERNRIVGFPARGVVLDQFTNLRFRGNDISECVGHATYAGENMVQIGAAGTATDTVVDFSSNLFRKTSGTANRLLYLRADGTAGAHHYQDNKIFSAGATITTAEVTLVDEPTVPVAVVSSEWDGAHLTVGGYHLWVDSTGDLRIKSTAPSSDTDGAVVGAQS